MTARISAAGEPSRPRQAQGAARRPRALALGAAAAMIGGALLLGAALLQPLKSTLGLTLLEDAFDARRDAAAEEQADPANWRPWPWAEIAPIGRIAFPRLGESRIVLDSVSGEALAWGVGHAPESADLGAAGVTALAGHRDGALSFLGRLQEGDEIEVTGLDGPPILYRVSAIEVIDSRLEGFRLSHAGPDELAIATCWPIEALVSGPERLLVTARRVRE